MNMNNQQSNWLFLALGMIILSITMLFPVGSDLSIFIQGGMILHNGGELYIDFFDVKPPFVYYLFEILFGLFDKNIAGYRIFDFLYQSAFLLSSIYIFRKLDIKNNITNIFLVVTPLLYTTMGYANVMQVESMFFLPFIWYFYLSVKSDNNYKSAITKGVLLALIFNLKYTLGIVLVADIYFAITNNKLSKQLIINILIQLSVFASLTLLLFLPVFLNGNLDGMLKFMDYMSVYSNYPAWSFSHILYLIKSMTIHFSDNLSLFLFVAMLLALFKKDKSDSKLVSTALLYFVLLLITIILERKGLAYHYQRIIPIYALLASFGVVYLLSKIKNLKMIYIIITSAFIIIYSPLPRYINLLKVPYYYFSDDENGYYNSFVDGKYGNMVYKHKKVAEYLNSTDRMGNVLLISANGNEMITFLNADYKYSMAMSSFYLNDISPLELQEIVLDELEKTEALVILKNDYSPITFFKNVSSFGAVKENKKFDKYINDYFDLDTTIENTFVIYNRKDN